MGCIFSNKRVNLVKTKNSLIDALCNNKTQKIIQFIKNQPDIIHSKINFRDDTILHYACSKQNVKLVEYLKKCGADLNVKNKKGKMPHDLTENKRIKQIIGIKIQQNNDYKRNIQTLFINLGINQQKNQPNHQISLKMNSQPTYQELLRYQKSKN